MEAVHIFLGTSVILHMFHKAPNAPAINGTCTDPDPATNGTAAYECPIGYIANHPAAPDGICVDISTCNYNCCQA